MTHRNVVLRTILAAALGLSLTTGTVSAQSPQTTRKVASWYCMDKDATAAIERLERMKDMGGAGELLMSYIGDTRCFNGFVAGGVMEMATFDDETYPICRTTDEGEGDSIYYPRYDDMAYRDQCPETAANSS